MVELQLEAILEAAKESAASPVGSTTLETPGDVGTPASDPPLTTAAHSAATTPPIVNGLPKGHHSGQPVPGGGWPMASLGAYRMSSGYYSAPNTTPYQSYTGSNGTQPPMRPLS